MHTNLLKVAVANTSLCNVADELIKTKLLLHHSHFRIKVKLE